MVQQQNWMDFLSNNHLIYDLMEEWVRVKGCILQRMDTNYSIFVSLLY